ncbi:amidohydrolase family protein [Hamadaea sp. NPDC051192]|uniref:amidohydrolase family protein n=1 Tax=Hamadaea sp. NPDC051192 TaxID=3154940 RepID=UPI00343062C1
MITHNGIAPLMTPADIAIGETLTAVQALNAGITTIVDNAHNLRSPEHADAAVEGLTRAGIRAVLAAGAPITGDDSSHYPHDLLRLRDRYFTSTDQLLTLRMFDSFPSPQSWTFANQHGLDLVVEVGDWIARLDELLASGLMRPGHTYNHCTGLTIDQWKANAGSGAAVDLVPRWDSHYGIGPFSPVLHAARVGVEIGISCDNELSYGYDMFTEMRFLMTIQRGLAAAAHAAGETDVPALYGVRDVLRAATVNGARCAGLTDQVGRIAPGAKADLVVLDLDQVHTQPFGSLLGTVVNFASIANVAAVFVDGTARKWNHRLVDIDYTALAREAENSRDRLLREHGTTPEAVHRDTDLRL